MASWRTVIRSGHTASLRKPRGFRWLILSASIPTEITEHKRIHSGELHLSTGSLLQAPFFCSFPLQSPQSEVCFPRGGHTLTVKYR